MFVSDNAVGYDIVLHCRRAPVAGGVVSLSSVSAQDIKNFIREKLSGSAMYKIHYLHVKREDEFDYRRLYAEWLCSSFAKSVIDVDFESFRRTVNEVILEIGNE
jgi:hypothetical protein